MKHGKTISELAMEIERQSAAKRDFIADTREITLNAFDPAKAPTLRWGGDEFGVTDIAHRQIGSALKIPADYYDRMRSENAPLLGMNVNAWLRSNPSRRMVRTLDGNARAFLTDRYQRIDNIEIAEAVLPVLADMPGIKIASCEITERRLYLKAVNERVRQDVKVGDTVEAGVLITNSEIGFGAVAITPLVHRLVCLNGMVVPDARFRRNHVGKRADEGEAVYELLSDETRAADDRALLLKVRDVVRASLDEAIFGRTVAKMRAATEGERLSDPIKAIETLSNKAKLLESEKPSILRHLIEGGDLSRYGLLNAVTRAAQDVESYDRSTELEEIGGRVLDLKQDEWREIALAA